MDKRWKFELMVTRRNWHPPEEPLAFAFEGTEAQADAVMDIVLQTVEAFGGGVDGGKREVLVWCPKRDCTYPSCSHREPHAPDEFCKHVCTWDYTRSSCVEVEVEHGPTSDS